MTKTLRLSASEALAIASDQVVEGCYHRLRFESAAGVSTMYLMPDQRFLARQLLDLQVDPTPAIKAGDSETERLLLADSSPSRGRADAPVTIVEFSDFQCPYCKAFEAQLDALPLDISPRVRVVYKYLPLSQHVWAREAATIAACAAARSQEAFWVLHGLFFRDQDSITPSTIEGLSLAAVGALPRVDSADFQTCVTAHSADSVLDRDLILARRLSVTSTPTVFLNGERLPPTSLSDGFLIERIRRSLSDPRLGAPAEPPPTVPHAR